MAPRYNLPIVTKALLLTLLFLYALSTAYQFRMGGLGFLPLSGKPSSVPQLVIVLSTNYIYPWTTLTAAFVESNLIACTISMLTLFFGGRYLERAWNSSQFSVFVLLVTLLPNLLTTLFYTTVASMGIINLAAVKVTIYGGIAYQAAFLVALKQLVPEHTVSLARNMVKMRLKHFPVLFLLVTGFISLCFGNGSSLSLALLGFTTSWTYLRFYRKTQLLSTSLTGDSSIIYGDASETFAFAHFFPDPIHTPISVLSNSIYSCLISLKLCSPVSAELIEASNEEIVARRDTSLPSINSSGSFGEISSSRREEAERRRALALKALDQRLHSAPDCSEPGGPLNIIPSPEEKVLDSHIASS